jgi:hypothetical protein
VGRLPAARPRAPDGAGGRSVQQARTDQGATVARSPSAPACPCGHESWNNAGHGRGAGVALLISGHARLGRGGQGDAAVSAPRAVRATCSARIGEVSRSWFVRPSFPSVAKLLVSGPGPASCGHRPPSSSKRRGPCGSRRRPRARRVPRHARGPHEPASAEGRSPRASEPWTTRNLSARCVRTPCVRAAWSFFERGERRGSEGPQPGAGPSVRVRGGRHA